MACKHAPATRPGGQRNVRVVCLRHGATAAAAAAALRTFAAAASSMPARLSCTVSAACAAGSGVRGTGGTTAGAASGQDALAGARAAHSHDSKQA